MPQLYLHREREREREKQDEKEARESSTGALTVEILYAVFAFVCAIVVVHIPFVIIIIRHNLHRDEEGVVRYFQPIWEHSGHRSDEDI